MARVLRLGGGGRRRDERGGRRRLFCPHRDGRRRLNLQSCLRGRPGLCGYKWIVPGGRLRIRVAEELNTLGYRRKTYQTKSGELYGGKSFDLDSVARVLQRKVYIGFITNERTGQEFPGQHQAIIAPEMFENVQKLMADHNHRGGEIHYIANRHGFLLKGLVRCGVCGGAVVGYARIKKGKLYRYYKCLAGRNGISEGCSFGSVNADKVEEYVIEKLAAIGWDRPFLERVVRKADELSKSSIRPLEKERREIEDQLQAVGNEVRQLLNLAKRSDSREAADELRRSETAKRALEARAAELDAQLAFRKRVVYDVDAVEGALRRFALFFRRLPLEFQIQTLKILVEKAVVRRDQIKLDFHEVGIKDLQKALDKKEAVAFAPYRIRERQGPNATAKSDNPRQASGTAVVECVFRSSRGPSRCEAEGLFGASRGPSERSDAELFVV